MRFFWREMTLKFGFDTSFSDWNGIREKTGEDDSTKKVYINDNEDLWLNDATLSYKLHLLLLFL
jgi:hypothetical protein